MIKLWQHRILAWNGHWSDRNPNSFKNSIHKLILAVAVQLLLLLLRLQHAAGKHLLTTTTSACVYMHGLPIVKFFYVGCGGFVPFATFPVGCSLLLFVHVHVLLLILSYYLGDFEFTSIINSIIIEQWDADVWKTTLLKLIFFQLLPILCFVSCSQVFCWYQLSLRRATLVAV